MFKVKKLKITGFKSFAFPTEIEIGNGVTGIVGPNGCGKSNIFESIRWVMGESSSKSLRSNSMDEVIFSGTDKIPAKNFAEVSIELEKISKKTDGKFNDKESFSISRSIERGVGSFYKMNNKEVRAKDISIFFSDTGSGSRSSSVISQGNIDQVINFKPIERKIILEDAAGTSGLQARRRESELKLSATENNLERLTDTLNNLENQKKSLQRQARQAQKYEQIVNDIKKNESLLLYLEWKSIEDEVSQSREKFKEINEKLASKRKQIDLTEAKKNSMLLGIDKINSDLNKFNIELQSKSAQRNNLFNEKNIFKNRKKEIEYFLQTLKKDKELEKNRLDEFNKNIELVCKTISNFPNIAESKNNLKKEQTEEFQLQEKLKDCESNLVNEMQLLLGEEFKLDNLKESQDNLINKRNELVISEKETKELIKQNKQFTFEKKINNLINEKNKLEENLDTFKRQINSLVSEKSELNEKLNKVNIQVEDSKRQLTENITEINTLKMMLKDLDLSKDSIYNLLKIKKGFEIPIFAILKEVLDAEINSSKKRWINISHNKLIPVDNALSNYIVSPKILIPFLSQVSLVNNTKEGFSKQKDLKTGQFIVSINGVIWRWDGFVNEKREGKEKWMIHKSRLANLDIIFHKTQDNVKLNMKNQDQLSSKIMNLEKKEFDFKLKTESLYSQINDISLQINEIKEKNLDTKSDLAKLDEKLNFIAKEKTSIIEELKKIDNLQKMNDLQNKTAHKTDKSIIENLIEELKSQINKKRDIITKHHEEIISNEIKLKYLQNDEIQNKKRVNECLNQIKNIEIRERKLIEENEKIQEFPIDLEVKLEKLETDNQNILVKINENNLKKEREKISLGELNKEIRSQIDSKDKLKDVFIRTEQNIIHLNEKQKDLRNIIFEKIKCQPSEILENNDLTEFKIPDMEELKSTLEKLIFHREQMGPVNLRAYIEEKEISEQFQTLELEKNDLVNAIEKFRVAISQINNEGKKKLIEAFAKVNKNFSILFQKLFDGGSASLELVKSDDPLQTGIEIFAKPPGKKLTSISLLSGGEKTLTAISLIFSIFLINPSPLCILDEVDAALDDVNVEKFCEIMDFIRKETNTRFLIISHHKTTMAMVDRVYGVTMTQKGISDVVSVDFNKEEFKVAI